MSDENPSAIFLAFDYGARRIGAAVGGSFSGQAEPLALVAVDGGGPDWRAIGRLVEQWRPAAFVLGLPLDMDGAENNMTKAARRFGAALSARYNLPVHMVDERLSTRIARERLTEAGVAPRRQKRHVDAVAAQTILQAFLDERGARRAREP